jgi:hypothetical protein
MVGLIAELSLYYVWIHQFIWCFVRLAERVGNVSGGGTFRALTRGYTHWASGRLDRLEVNCCHPDYYHVRCQLTPSMKPGLYHVYILFDREPTVKVAQCECAAG